MLHKIYLVSSKIFQKLAVLPSKIKRRRKLSTGQSEYDKWIQMSERLREEDVTRIAQLKDIAKFMKHVLLERPIQRFESRNPITAPPVPVKMRRVVGSLPFAAADNTRRKPKFVIDEGDTVEEDLSDLSRENFGELANRYLKPYLHNARFLDKQYGIRRENDGGFMVGDFTLTVDDTNDISINGRHFKETRGLWGLLIRKILLGASIQQAIGNDIRISYSLPTLICRVTKPG